MTTYTQVSSLLSFSLPSLSLFVSVHPTSILSSLPSYNVFPFTYLNPVFIPSYPPPTSLHISSSSYKFPNTSSIPKPNITSFDPIISSLVQTIIVLQQLAHLTQSKYNIQACDVTNTLSLDILCAIITQNVEVPCLKTYTGMGDPYILVKTFHTICCDFAHDYRLMAKFFSHAFRDRTSQ